MEKMRSHQNLDIFLCIEKKNKSCMTENVRPVTADCTGSNSMSEISCVNNTSNVSKYYIPVSLGENKQSSRSTTA